VADPYGFLAALREEHGPVAWSVRHQAWILSSYAEVAGALRDERLSADRITPMERRLDEERRHAMSQTLELLRGWMVFHDEPDHARLRDPVRRAFTPRSVERLRSEVEALVAGLLDEVAEAGGCDLKASFAFPLPAMVIASLLGVPAEDRARFGTWSRKLAALVFGASDNPDHYAIGAEGGAEFSEYFGALIARREREPGDDLISALVASRDRGDGLTAAELVGACTLLLFAGHETTTSLIANAALALARNPDVARRLRHEPDRWGVAVEEMLRYDGPAKVQVRTVVTAHERGGHRLAAGDLVYLAFCAANRDPAQFDHPDRLDVDRDAGAHLGFGLGPHFCLGAALARLEARIALRALIERFDELELAGEVAWEPLIVGRSLRALPLRLR
jgi:cytochrome P450